MNYIISAAIGYLLGSIPTAYLIFKKKQNEDITLKGTGNVGAHNIYEITNSKMLGIIVMLIDMAKGSLSALIPLFIFGDVFISNNSRSYNNYISLLIGYMGNIMVAVLYD